MSRNILCIIHAQGKFGAKMHMAIKLLLRCALTQVMYRTSQNCCSTDKAALTVYCNNFFSRSNGGQLLFWQYQATKQNKVMS